MDYIPGVTPNERLADTSLPEKQVVALGSQLAEGLAAAHEHPWPGAGRGPEWRGPPWCQGIDRAPTNEVRRKSRTQAGYCLNTRGGPLT